MIAEREDINRVIKKISSMLSLNLFNIKLPALLKRWRAEPAIIPECQQKLIGERSADIYYYMYL